MCLFLCNKNRLGNNLALYNDSIVPEHLPGGGGFSIFQFTLQNLYTMHQYVRNWWTTSNSNLPLCRYLKCKLKVYQSEDVDIVIRYQRHFPMTSSQLTYPTMQPSVLMMLKNSIMIPSKKTKQLKRGYKTIYIKPPELLTNKWFFQKDLANMPLFLLQTTAASFDHYYISTSSESNNVTIPVINTNLFQNRNFGKNDIYHCKQIGDQKIYLWATWEHIDPLKEKPTAKNLILLANGKSYTAGWDYEEFQRFSTVEQTQKNWTYYKQHIHIYSGNPFYKQYLNPETGNNLTIYQSVDYEHILPDNENSKVTELTLVHNPFILYTRYNPNTDNGTTNNTYLLNNYRPEHGWDPPANHKLTLSGFPLYIQWWGFADFQKRQHEVPNIDTSQIFVTQTSTLHPDDCPAYVPIGYDFINGKSPYENDVNPLDKDRWYPMLQYQEPAINYLLQCGPGTAKLETKKTVEAKCSYCFYFKFGGNPAPMVELNDPTNQPKYPIPNNFSKTTSLQDPTTPPELFLYNFDQRRSLLTDSAAKRICKDWSTNISAFTDGTTTPAAPQVQEQTLQTSEDETTDSEKEEEPLLQQLINQRRKQLKLKRRIKLLLTKMQNTE